MPTYEVTDNTTGKKYELTGDSPPTDAELEQIFGAVSAPEQNKTWGQVGAEAISNIPSSAGNFASNMFQAVRHPIDTIEGLTKIAVGGVEKVFPQAIPEEGRGNVEAFDALINFFKQRYGGEENIKNTIATDPVGTMADLSSVLGIGGKMLGSTGSELARGAQATSGTNALTKAANLVDPVNAAMKVGSGAAWLAGHPVKFGLGLLTGKGKPLVEEALKAAKEGGEANKNFLAGLRGKMSESKAVETMREAYQALKDKRGSEYSQKLAEVTQASGNMRLDTAPIDAALADVMKRFRIDNITKTKRGYKIEGLTTLNGADKADLSQILTIIDDWKKHPQGSTALGLDSLKQQLDGFFVPNARIGAVSTTLKNTVRNILETNVPGYKDMTQGYAIATEQLNELNNALSLGKKGNANTILRKAFTTLKEDMSFRRDLMDVLQQNSGKQIKPSLAGHAFNNWLPQGLARPLMAGEIGLGMLFARDLPSALGVGATLGASSPRLTGELLHAVGATERYASPLGKYLKAYGTPAFQAGRATNESRKKP